MANVSFKGAVGKVRGLQFSNDGKPRFSFSVAENHSRFDKQENKYVDTGVTWFNITVFGKDAENLADVIAEGRKQIVTVAGRQSTRAYTTQNGEERTSLDVIADHVGIVHRAPQGNQPPANNDNWGTANQGGDQWGGSSQPPAFDNPSSEAPF